MTVTQDCRGRGIGRALMRELLQRAREAGYARAGLDVADTNPRAPALYEGLGFRLVETRRSTLGGPWGRVADHHYLEYALRP